MSDKLVRDELLRSHRYQGLSSDTAKLLFLHLVLSSDSLSNAEATTTALSIIMRRDITEEAAAVLLGEMADRDLIRLYDDGDKRYVHIPRSRQRIRYLTGKHPRPPDHLEDKQIKALINKVGLKSEQGQTIYTRSRSEVVAVVEKSTSAAGSVDNSDGKGETWAEHWIVKGAAMGMEARSGESERAYCDRVMAKSKTKP